MRIIFLDTETTGNSDTDRLCQLAVKERYIDEPLINALYKPPVPISIESMAIHHITERMVAYKLAYALDPSDILPNYRLQYLRSLLDLDVEAEAHDAWGDVLVLEALFERFAEKMKERHGTEEDALSAMLAISARPLLFTTLRFGKYNGKQIEEVVKTDQDYWEWLLREKEKDPAGEADWIYTLKHYLAA